MTFVFRQYAGTYNYSYSVTDDHRRHIFPLSSSVDEEPEPNWSWTRHLQNSNQAGTFLKVLRTSTEPNRTVIIEVPEPNTKPIHWVLSHCQYSIYVSMLLTIKSSSCVFRLIATGLLHPFLHAALPLAVVGSTTACFTSGTSHWVCCSHLNFIWTLWTDVYSWSGNCGSHANFCYHFKYNNWNGCLPASYNFNTTSAAS